MMELVLRTRRADLERGYRCGLEKAVEFARARRTVVTHRDDRLAAHEYVVQAVGHEDRIHGSREGLERLAVRAAERGGQYHRGALVALR